MSEDVPAPEPALATAALAAIGEGVMIADRAGRIVYANPRSNEILGVVPAEGPPQEWARHFGVFTPGDERPFPADQYPLVPALHGEHTDDVEILIRNPAHPKGALIAVTGRPVLDASGAIIGAVAVFRDITRQRELERLRRLVPVCSWCHKIRSDNGYWQQLEAYIETSQKALVTHGMCPECERQWEAKAQGA